MRTSRLSEIMRQKDPELLKAVEHLAKGETAAGVKMLADQGRITEIADGHDRIAAIAKDYAAKPENTLIVSPDNRSRVAINQAARSELQANGTLAKDSHEFSTLAHRSDMTGADRMWAARYSFGDMVQYTTGSKAHGIERGSYVTVQAVDAKANILTMQRKDGEFVSYDSKRLKGVNVYREVQREIAEGERIQFTTNSGLFANRDLGTVTQIEPQRITVRMDGPEQRLVTFDPNEMRHFDHGYVVTSHSAQGLTTEPRDRKHGWRDCPQPHQLPPGLCRHRNRAKHPHRRQDGRLLLSGRKAHQPRRRFGPRHPHRSRTPSRTNSKTAWD